MRFILYASRWQLSTPILWIVLFYTGPTWVGTVISNLIGASIFYFVDRHIFSENKGG